MTVNIQPIVDYYTNLLIIQYNQLPKARATVALFIKELMANGVFFDVRDGYTLDDAEGLQLDILGKYIGADRFYTGQTLDGFFTYITYDTDPIYGVSGDIGYADYTDVGTKVGKWLTYDDILSQTFSLNDSDYRTLLKLKILQNNSNHSDQQINDGIFALFGLNLIPIDNYDMTMTYIVNPSIQALITVANIKGILPKPMGVAIDIEAAQYVLTDGGDVITTDDGDVIILG